MGTTDGSGGIDEARARVRAARHWAFLSPGRLATVRAEVERLTEAGVTGVMVPQIFGPPWATLGVVAACSDLELAAASPWASCAARWRRRWPR